tara:strand:+ start:1882 stop:2376 length:495 start_codon:yes stop_codon:yes gene_type:complete
MILEKGLSIIGEFLKAKFIEELLSQDHNASGEHIDSMRFDVNKTGSGYELVFESLEYNKYLDQGTKKGRYVPIQALIEWIEAKGIASGDKEVKSIAFAIRQKIFNEGTPTAGSYKFSKNGRRKDWIGITIKNNTAEVSEKLAFIIGDNINFELKNLANNINSVK